MKGVFGLEGSTDLHRKLKWEFATLSKDPKNPYLAFNFFVTAWHLLEWVYPGTENKEQRTGMREANPILKVCEHLAVGAKHFEATRKRINSVNTTGEGGVWAEGVWAKGVWRDGVWATWLVVHLDGEAKEAFGERKKVMDLAKAAMEFWEGELGNPDAA
ncbi:MAG: hypothetical protein RIC85_04725 [Gammaproteobacteria bacterium]